LSYILYNTIKNSDMKVITYPACLADELPICHLSLPHEKFESECRFMCCQIRYSYLWNFV